MLEVCSTYFRCEEPPERMEVELTLHMQLRYPCPTAESVHRNDDVGETHSSW